MRLRIGKNGQYLDLGRGLSFQLEMNSPIWFGDRDPDYLPTVKTYSITLPNTSKNRLMLQRPDLLDNPAPFLDEDGWEVYFDGWLILTGRLEVEDTQAGEDFRVTFVGGLAGNLQVMKDTYLPDLLREDVRTFDNIITHANQVIESPWEYDYVFPTVITALNPGYDEEGDPTQYEYVNRYNTDTYHRVFNDQEQGITIYCSLIPMLRVWYIFRQAFAAANYSIAGVFDSSVHAEELRKLILFNNVTLDKLVDAPGGEVGWDNIDLDNTIRLAQHVPSIPISEFVKRICKTFGWGLFIDSATKKVSIQPYTDVLQAELVDWTKKVDPRYLRGRQTENVPDRFEYDHIDDGYEENWPLKLNNLEVEYRFETYGDVVAHGFTTGDIGTLVYLESFNQFFVVGDIINGQPVLVNRGKNLGVVNEYSNNEYPIETDTLHMVTPSEKEGIPLLVGWNVSGPDAYPVWMAGVVSPWLEDGEPLKDEIILLFSRERTQDGSIPNPSPLATHNTYDGYFELEIGNLSLLMTGEKGIYNTWHKQWIDLLKEMRRVTYQTRLTASDLATFSFLRRIVINQHVYIPKRLRITMTTEEISPAAIEYMQLK